VTFTPPWQATRLQLVGAPLGIGTSDGGGTEENPVPAALDVDREVVPVGVSPGVVVVAVLSPDVVFVAPSLVAPSLVVAGAVVVRDGAADVVRAGAAGVVLVTTPVVVPVVVVATVSGRTNR
jgi:hypothetical protein